MNSTILIATHNKDKVREITAKLSALSIEVKSLLDFPNISETVEDGATLEANAVKKAREGFFATGIPTLADDTGLEVEALGGAPGVFSSRYAGEEVSYADNRGKLLREMQDIPVGSRNAVFKTVMALYDSSGYICVEGMCEGIILNYERGEGGFGYDPVFFVPEYGQTFAEMSLELKNKISHRGRALEKAIAVIMKRWNL